MEKEIGVGSKWRTVLLELITDYILSTPLLSSESQWDLVPIPDHGGPEIGLSLDGSSEYGRFKGNH